MMGERCAGNTGVYDYGKAGQDHMATVGRILVLLVRLKSESPATWQSVGPPVAGTMATRPPLVLTSKIRSHAMIITFSTGWR
jgi:hypothetical protein